VTRHALPRTPFGIATLLAACTVDPPKVNLPAAPPPSVVHNTSPSDATPPPEGPWLTAEVTPEIGHSVVFTATVFQGGWTDTTWGFEAIAQPPRILTFAVAGPVTLTASVLGSLDSGTAGRYADSVGYSGADALFQSTSGTLTVTRLESSGSTGTVTHTVDGMFDAFFANDPSAGGTGTHIVGSFGNVALPPYASGH
jgi:hypothetical protein